MTRSGQGLRDLLFANPGTKAFSLLLATGLWYAVSVAGPRAVLGTTENSKLALNCDLSGVGEGVAEFADDRHDLKLAAEVNLVRVRTARFALRIARREELEEERG